MSHSTFATVRREHLFAETHPLARFTDEDAPASALLVAADGLPIRVRSTSVATEANEVQIDYAQIDRTLDIANDIANNIANVDSSVPPTGTSYAGLTPAQRGAFLMWLSEPLSEAPPAFQQLWLAQLETHLLDEQRRTAIKHLRVLHETSAWQRSVALARALLLGLWIEQWGEQLLAWIAAERVPESLLGVALGHAALLGETLTPQALRALLSTWSLSAEPPSVGVCAHRLASLRERVGGDPLAHALAQLDDEARQSQPWRTTHRDVRIALPQPDLRPRLEPLLRDLLLADSGGAVELVREDEYEEEASAPLIEPEQEPTAPKWMLVLEFGESRSDYFEHVLHWAHQRESFQTLLDEDRQIVYRVVYTKRDLRYFWRIWEYVQSWSATRVFVNGQEIAKWQVYPYSLALR